MNQIIKYAPGIIENASKSPLGIIALAILVCSTLAYLFFRHESLTVRIAVYLTIVGSLVAYGIAITRATIAITGTSDEGAPVMTQQHANRGQPKIDKLIYAGRVIDEITNSPIHGAKVQIDISGVPPAFTDSEGQYHFQTNSPFEPYRVRVTADGYNSYDEMLLPGKHNEFSDIRLRLKQGERHFIHLSGTVIDRDTTMSIPNAVVTLTIDDEEPFTLYTDSRGAFTFPRIPSKAFGHIRVSAPDYKTFDRNFSPRNRAELADIRLERKPSP